MEAELRSWPRSADSAGKRPFAIALSLAPGGSRALRSAYDKALFERREGLRALTIAVSDLLGPDARRHGVAIVRDGTGKPHVLIGGARSGVDVSISHSGACILAGAARGRRVGVDIEPCTPIAPELWHFFLGERERRACAADPAMTVWYWIVKEATYKALATRQPIDFRQIEVSGDTSGMRVSCAAARTVPEVFLHEHCGFAAGVVLL